jgi:hypothetical protein
VAPWSFEASAKGGSGVEAQGKEVDRDIRGAHIVISITVAILTMKQQRE